MELELLFPMHLRESLKMLKNVSDLEEIRIRIGQPLFFCTQKKELVLVKNEGIRDSWEAFGNMEAYRITEADIMEMQNYISNYSLYAWQEELKNGFMTIQGGHRIGLCGSTKNNNGKIIGISYLTFFNIRVAHERIGCATEVLKYIKRADGGIYNTLLVSKPGAGKTTLLRDCIRSLSYGEKGFKGKKIGIVDERSEIAACYHGIPQNDLGIRTDVLDGCNKPEGMRMLLRTMSPEIIGVDELGTAEDFKAVEEAAYSGCNVIGTIHAGTVEELQEKPALQVWCQKGVFERFILIKKEENGERCFRVYDNQWERLY